MNHVERLAYMMLGQFERRKFMHDDVEYICMKRHDTLLSAQKHNGWFRFQLHCAFQAVPTYVHTYSHINRPRDMASEEMLRELGWQN